MATTELLTIKIPTFVGLSQSLEVERMLSNKSQIIKQKRTFLHGHTH